MCTPESRRAARGMVLAELMVGLALGLLVVLAALLASAATLAAAAGGRDAADLQQRADMALKAIGYQIQRAGALQLESTESSVHFSGRFTGWQGDGMSVSGIEGGPGRPDTLRLSFEPADDDKDCLGGGPLQDPPDSSILVPHIDSEFTIAADPTDGGRLALYCKGTKPTSHKQQVIAGVDDMQLLYAVDGPDGHLQWRTANDITAATPVRAIGVCLQLSGERQQNAPGALDCQGAPITAPKSAGRAVRLARAIFRLRHAAG